MSVTYTSSTGAENPHSQPTGWRRFVYSTNHKDIGTMYLVFALCTGTIGVAFWASGRFRHLVASLGRCVLNSGGHRFHNHNPQHRDDHAPDAAVRMVNSW